MKSMMEMCQNMMKNMDKSEMMEMCQNMMGNMDKSEMMEMCQKMMNMEDTKMPNNEKMAEMRNMMKKEDFNPQEFCKNFMKTNHKKHSH